MDGHWTRDLRAALVGLVGGAMLVLGAPGLDLFSAKTLRTEQARAAQRDKPLGWLSIAAADLNRAVRLPIVRMLTPIQRPLRIAQGWGLYGQGPNRIKRLEIRVDGTLVHRTNDAQYAWLSPVLRFRRVRPIVAAVCGDRSVSVAELVAFVGKRAARDLDANEVSLTCTAGRWPGTEVRPIVTLTAQAPDWVVQP